MHEGPLNIAEGNLNQQLLNYTGEPIPNQNQHLPKGKAIELANMSGSPKHNHA